MYVGTHGLNEEEAAIVQQVLFLFSKYQLPYQAGRKKRKKSGANPNSWSVKDHQIYRSPLVKWLTLENEKKKAVSQDWRHKKENPKLSEE